MNKQVITIEDDFDLGKIAGSGQCFRAKRFENDTWRFITRDKILYIRDEGNHQFSVSCDLDEWNDTWRSYFDLARSYRDVFEKECGKHPFIDKAIQRGRGIRILKQDPWETLITFIISQRKSIKSISTAVEKLAEKFGHRITTDFETVYTFPSPAEMREATAEDLKECGLGYRVPYVLDAIAQVGDGRVDLDAIALLDNQKLLDALQKIYGVGEKVANCVALFAYGRMTCIPIDVWIARAIEEDCEGQSPFHLCEENAGIIQQCIFYYKITHRG